MEGIIIFNGTVEDRFIEAWFSYGHTEFYLDDYDLLETDGLIRTDVFMVGGPKCLIKW